MQDPNLLDEVQPIQPDYQEKQKPDWRLVIFAVIEFLAWLLFLVGLVFKIESWSGYDVLAWPAFAVLALSQIVARPYLFKITGKRYAGYQLAVGLTASIALLAYLMRLESIGDPFIFSLPALVLSATMLALTIFKMVNTKYAEDKNFYKGALFMLLGIIWLHRHVITALLASY